MRPMAPRTPLSRQGVAAYLRGASPELPLFLGSPHLHGGAAVLLEEGVLRLRRLELADEGQEIYFRHQEQGTEPFRPESVDAYQLPTGAVMVEGADVESFLVELEKIAWPPRW